MIEIMLTRERVRLGQQISGMVTWTGEPGAVPRGLAIRAGWRTEGRGTAARATVAELQHTPGPASGALLQLPFELTVPADGPISYRGRLISIIWELSVQVNLPWSRDEQRVVELQILPRQAGLQLDKRGQV